MGSGAVIASVAQWAVNSPEFSRRRGRSQQPSELDHFRAHRVGDHLKVAKAILATTKRALPQYAQPQGRLRSILQNQGRPRRHRGRPFRFETFVAVRLHLLVLRRSCRCSLLLRRQILLIRQTRVVLRGRRLRGFARLLLDWRCRGDVRGVAVNRSARRLSGAGVREDHEAVCRVVLGQAAARIGSGDRRGDWRVADGQDWCFTDYVAEDDPAAVAEHPVTVIREATTAAREASIAAAVPGEMATAAAHLVTATHAAAASAHLAAATHTATTKMGAAGVSAAEMGTTKVPTAKMTATEVATKAPGVG